MSKMFGNLTVETRFCLFGCMEVDSTCQSLLTSQLLHTKAPFTCVVFTNKSHAVDDQVYCHFSLYITD